MSRDSRSPLKDKPLRTPGQSVQEKLADLQYDQLLGPALIALVLLVITAIEWSRDYFSLPPRPDLYMFGSAAGVAYAWWRIRRALPEVERLKLGLDGERVVGQYLERLRGSGYSVFHDVMGTGFNVDHVIIGPAGIYTIETKTFSKPTGPDTKIDFDGETLRVAGYEPDRDPIIQGKAQAAWLREILLESTGQKFFVRPVIVFPGWYVEQAKGSTREVWVLNPKALPDFLDHEPQVLSESDAKLASFHLSRFVRSTAV